MRRDAALSDIVGTMILLGITISLVAIFATETLSSVGENDETPQLDVLATARAGESSITLVHAGGPPIDAGEVRLVVSAGATVLSDAPLGAIGDEWKLGEVRELALGAPLPAGQDIELSFVWTVRPTTVASAAIHLPPSSLGAPLGGPFTVSLLLDPASSETNVTLPGSLYLRATIEHPQGRLAVGSVTANLSELSGGSALPLVDDGTGGDAWAGDGVFTLYTMVPAVAPIRTSNVSVTATDLDGALAVGQGRVHVFETEGDVQLFGGNTTSYSQGGWYYNNDTGWFYVDSVDDPTPGTTSWFYANETGAVFGNDTGTFFVFQNASGNFYGNSSGAFTGNGSGNFNGNFTGNFTPKYPERQVYNKSLIESFSHRILKYEGGSHDQITTEVKLKLVADPIVMADGGLYTFKRAYVNYDWLKPGNIDPFRLNQGGIPPNDWFCRGTDLRVEAFKMNNATINSFDRQRDPIFYYFILEWDRVGGGTHVETVSTDSLDQYFVLRRTDQVKVVLDDGDWTQSFQDCLDR